MPDIHVYDRFKIPLTNATSTRQINALYNMSPDEIDELRCGTEGVWEPGGFRGVPFDSVFDRLSDQECKEIIEFKKATGCSAIHLITDEHVPCKDQNGHGYCWAYGAISAYEYGRILQRLPYVRLSPHSVAAGYMKGADRGGWASMAFEWASKYGVVPDDLWPRHSRNYRLWDQPEIAEAAAQFKPFETVEIEPGDMQAVRTAMCKGLALGLGLMWWGHLLAFLELDWDPQLGWLYLERNSHTSRYGNDGFAWHTERSAKHGGGSVVIVA